MTASPRPIGFITFEGIEGSGKTTQIQLLSNHFEDRGIDHLLTREPGGTPIGDQIRRLVLDPRNSAMTPVCELLLYAAARAQHLDQVIRPALEAGRLVLCDRFVDATFAYQGYGRAIPLDLIDALHHLKTLALRPDLTLLFDIDTRLALERARVREHGGTQDETPWAALLVCGTLLCRADEGRPWGACRSCRRIAEAALVHPGVRLVLPEKKSDFDRPAREEETAAGIDPQAAQAEALRNPAWSVLIDRVRQGIGFLQRRPAEGRQSILIVDQAHRMEAASANALLKTLEEPPPHAILILVTPSWHALLPTIRSRCQAVPFQLVPRTRIVSYLVERRELGAEESVLRAGLSGGR